MNIVGRGEREDTCYALSPGSECMQPAVVSPAQGNKFSIRESADDATGISFLSAAISALGVLFFFCFTLLQQPCLPAILKFFSFF